MNLWTEFQVDAYFDLQNTQRMLYVTTLLSAVNILP